jgi:site-specific DNA-methyltransferase (adenine-specific)
MKNKLDIKTGDIFQLGNHRIACGNSSDKDLVAKLLKDEKIASINSDIPYGISVTESKRGFKQKLSCDKIIVNDQLQSDEEYKKFNLGWLEAIKPHLAKKNSYYIFNSDKMVWLLREALIESGFKFSQMIIWVKNHAVMGRLNYLPMHELILYGWLGTHEFKKSQDKSVLFYPKPNKSKLHPTMKPVGLIRNLILNSTNIGDIVWDGFLGSGTTLIAAEQTRRKCYGIEIDPGYCQTIIERYEKLSGLKAKKLN